MPLSAYARPHVEEELLTALKEIGADGDLSALEAALGDPSALEGLERLDAGDAAPEAEPGDEAKS